MEIIDPELKTLQSGRDSQDIKDKVKGHYKQHTLSYWWLFVLNKCEKNPNFQILKNT